MKVIDKKDNTIKVTEMKDGEIAVIVRWGKCNTLYIDIVIQRTDNMVFELGGRNYWENIFGSDNYLFNDGNYMVEVLPKGTRLEI